MNLTFNKTSNGWVAEFNAPTHFNLHIERDDAGRLDIYRRTAGTDFDFMPMPYKGGKTVIDTDIPVMQGKEYRVVSGTEPKVAIVTFAE